MSEDWTTREPPWVTPPEVAQEAGEQDSLPAGDGQEAAAEPPAGEAQPEGGLRPEPVELAPANSAEEGVPLIGGEPEHRPVTITAVPDADHASGQVRHLYAVTVREAQ